MEFAIGAPLVVLAAFALILLALLACLLWLPAAGRLDVSRSVLAHVSAERAWEFIRHLPALHTRHGKGRDVRSLADWTLREGDGESPGSGWRVSGTWRGLPYWADIEVIRRVPCRELAFRLRRDSLRTQRGLLGHLGSLVLEPVGADATKITWTLHARLRGPRLRFARLASSARLQARLYDLGLRSLKIEIDTAAEGAEESAPVPVPRHEPVAGPTLPARRVPPRTTV